MGGHAAVYTLIQETDDPTLTMQQRETAVSLYAGDFLEGFYVNDAPDFEHWMTSCEYFQQAMIHVLMDLASRHVARRGPARGQAMLSRLLTMAPGNEAAHRLMMQLLANTGRAKPPFCNSIPCAAISLTSLASSQSQRPWSCMINCWKEAV